MFYYFHRLLYKLGVFKRINLIVKTKIGNKRFRIPIIYGFGYYHLLKHEEWFIALLKRILPLDEGAFVDVGMNIGQTLLKVSSVDPNKEYFGFEPNPACYYYSQKMAETNKLHKCHLFPVGLFDKSDLLMLHIDMDIASGGSVLKDFRTNKERYNKHINVAVFKGDEILEKAGIRIGILKADVEGAELEVVKGALKIIERDQPFLILEILPVYSLENDLGKYRKQRQNELLCILSNIGYSMFRINSEDASLIKLNKIEVHGNMSETNYLFVPRAKKVPNIN